MRFARSMGKTDGSSDLGKLNNPINHACSSRPDRMGIEVYRPSSIMAIADTMKNFIVPGQTPQNIRIVCKIAENMSSIPAAISPL